MSNSSSADDAQISMSDKFPFEIHEDEIDKSITPIFKDYPRECLPEKFKNPSGAKAKKLQYEIIDPNLYEPPARMVACRIKRNRLEAWIRALGILYYEHFGKKAELYQVDWYDDPHQWEVNTDVDSTCKSSDKNSIEESTSVKSVFNSNASSVDNKLTDNNNNSHTSIQANVPTSNTCTETTIATQAKISIGYEDLDRLQSTFVEALAELENQVHNLSMDKHKAATDYAELDSKFRIENNKFEIAKTRMDQKMEDINHINDDLKVKLNTKCSEMMKISEENKLLKEKN
ncbi:Hypothetical predicted protein [Mytilus galloprovincialis]|uniref:Uncharacterized protein n=1 Tax=Mytilus galloprovincialis TaxID=29158 RepID=A0A8B6F210_MYTGA|nr:Hypothetical predicted protein [Mytilus galloprovincialis]